MRLVAMQALGDEHAGAQATVNTGRQVDRTTGIPNLDSIAIGNTEAHRIVRVDEDTGLTLPPDAPRSLVE